MPMEEWVHSCQPFTLKTTEIFRFDRKKPLFVPFSNWISKFVTLNVDFTHQKVFWVVPHPPPPTPSVVQVAIVHECENTNNKCCLYVGVYSVVRPKWNHQHSLWGCDPLTHICVCLRTSARFQVNQQLLGRWASKLRPTCNKAQV